MVILGVTVTIGGLVTATWFVTDWRIGLWTLIVYGATLVLIMDRRQERLFRSRLLDVYNLGEQHGEQHGGGGVMSARRERTAGV